jgi:gamma-glutamyltranspeptidase
MVRNPNALCPRTKISIIGIKDGIITLEDLAQYQPKFKTPLNVTLQNGGYTSFAPRPPSSGVVSNFMLKVLDGIFYHH